VETQVVLTELLRRMPDWSVVNEPVLASSSFIRGFKRLDLSFTPGPRLGGGLA
jgi:cytochrome P450